MREHPTTIIDRLRRRRYNAGRLAMAGRAAEPARQRRRTGMVMRRYVGAEVKRKEDPRLITGTGMYVDDLQLPGMLHIAMVRSPYPHARIRSIDKSAALAMPGVVDVMTGDELAAICGPMSAGSAEGESGEQANFEELTQSALNSPTIWQIAREKVRYVGEIVAAVVAESRYEAEDAALAVEVDYEELPSVMNPEAAMQDGAPLVYDNVPNNVGARWD